MGAPSTYPYFEHDLNAFREQSDVLIAELVTHQPPEDTPLFETLERVSTLHGLQLALLARRGYGVFFSEAPHDDTVATPLVHPINVYANEADQQALRDLSEWQKKHAAPNQHFVSRMLTGKLPLRPLETDRPSRDPTYDPGAYIRQRGALTSTLINPFNSIAHQHGRILSKNRINRQLQDATKALYERLRFKEFYSSAFTPMGVPELLWLVDPVLNLQLARMPDSPLPRI